MDSTPNLLAAAGIGAKEIERRIAETAAAIFTDPAERFYFESGSVSYPLAQEERRYSLISLTCVQVGGVFCPCSGGSARRMERRGCEEMAHCGSILRESPGNRPAFAANLPGNGEIACVSQEPMLYSPCFHAIPDD